LARQRLFGAHNLLELPGRPAAVKTGTTNDNRDAWTAGYTPSLVTVVWVGNFNNDPMNGIQGSTGATPIWHYFMTRALANSPVETFSQPTTGLVAKPITAAGSLSCSQNTTVRTELFLTGTEPTTHCSNQPFGFPTPTQTDNRSSGRNRRFVVPSPIHLFPFSF
jgi:membrane carboxypeptidase/penicillin-binding protein